MIQPVWAEYTHLILPILVPDARHLPSGLIFTHLTPFFSRQFKSVLSLLPAKTDEEYEKEYELLYKQDSGHCIWTMDVIPTEEWIMDVILYNRRVDNGRYIIQQKSG